MRSLNVEPCVHTCATTVSSSMAANSNRDLVDGGDGREDREDADVSDVVFLSNRAVGVCFFAAGTCVTNCVSMLGFFAL